MSWLVYIITWLDKIVGQPIQIIPIQQIPTGVFLILLTVICIVIFVIGAPLFHVFSIWVVGFQLRVTVVPMANIAIESFDFFQSFALVAIPIFILVGDLMSESGVARNLLDFSQDLVGWLPGSAGNTVLAASGIFSAITGSNVATTASIGRGMHSELVDEGYSPTYAAATIASGGTVGIIIPPSVIMIVYAVTFNVSVTDLFLAGLVPGLAMIGALLVVNSYSAYREGFGLTDSEFSLRELLSSTRQASIGIATIAILLGGIYAGVFSPTEASSVGVVFVFITSLLTGRITNVNQIIRASYTALSVIGTVMPIVVMSVLIQQDLTFLGIQSVVSDILTSIQYDWLLIIVMLVIMLIAGSLLDSIPNLVLTAPLLADAAAQLGLSPIMWGVIFLIGDAIGFITPPYGVNLYVIAGITDLDYINVARDIFVYLGALIGVWLLFFIFPSLDFLAP